MTAKFRVLIVGGYGTFGGRLVELLENDCRLTLLVAGRSLGHARDYCLSRFQAVAKLIPTEFDRATAGAEQLRTLRPKIVVDASGPFQAYGSNGYRLIELCIACGIHYLDLADGSEFVDGISRFDAAARAANVYVLSGASTFPVLTAAAVRRLAVGMNQVQSIRAGLAPTPYAGVGQNVIRAIAGYAGKPVSLRRAGRPATGRPFTESIDFVIAVPGRIPLGRTRFSLIDVPDLRLLPGVWPEATDIWMGAGPAPAILHRALTAFAWLVRLRLLPSLTWLAAAMHFVSNHARWGDHRGGMFVDVRGQGSDGALIVREWHLVAEGDDGPLIPSMAVAAIVRKSLAGHSPASGARPAVADVDLSDYEALFESRTIFTGIRQREPQQPLPLYQRILGPAWDRLPEQIRELHAVSSASTFQGECTVVEGRSPLARLVGAAVGFPRAGTTLPITVTLTAGEGGERWVRTTLRRTFSSVQSLGRGRSDGLVVERFGPIAVHMALVVDGLALRYVVRRWTLLGVPLPLWLGPRSAATETADEGRFHFNVEIRHFLTGVVVRYRGWLVPSVRGMVPVVTTGSVHRGDYSA